ncbi:MAG: hypothetical protein R3D00_22010 [Bacteroidia bacterium]
MLSDLIGSFVSDGVVRVDGMVSHPPLLQFFIELFHVVKPFEIQTFLSVFYPDISSKEIRKAAATYRRGDSAPQFGPGDLAINPKPNTQQPKPKTQQPKPKTQNPKPNTQNPTANSQQPTPQKTKARNILSRASLYD